MTRQELTAARERQKIAYVEEIKRLQQIFNEQGINEEISKLEIKFNKSQQERYVWVEFKSKYSTFRDINNQSIHRYICVSQSKIIKIDNKVSYHPVIGSGRTEDESEFPEYNKIKTILINEYFIWLLRLDTQIVNIREMLDRLGYEDVSSQEYYNFYNRFLIATKDRNPIYYSAEEMLDNFKTQIKKNLIIHYKDFDLDKNWQDDLVTDEFLYNPQRYIFF